ncbi:MAG TPA: nickel-binding protein [Puia sp.]|nr:nickel-binding protein [Puia sp.]
MPIYMDRHDITVKVTAEEIAQMHQEDLKIQDKYCCRGLTYWFDSARNTAFCLIEAPNEAAVSAMHKHAHGQVPGRIIEVNPALVESFLGRIEDPQKPTHLAENIIDESAFRFIMLVTVHLLSTPSKDAGVRNTRWEDFSMTVQRIVASSGGRTVKQNSHRLIISFASVSSAVETAFEIQSRFDKSTFEPHATLKIGLNAGEPVTDKTTFFEDTIRMAERMCKIVEGDIILSAEVKQLYDNEKPQGLPNRKKARCLTETDQRFLMSLMDFTESAWKNFDFKVDDFGKPVGCSKSQLYRKMMSLTGKSPNSFIKEYRLNEALALLNKKVKNVSEIAFETGFNSPSYFSKCFQKQYGRSPSDYLAELAGR